MSLIDAQPVAAVADWVHVFDALPAPLFLKNEGHELIAASEPFCQLVGCSKEAILGFQDFEVQPGKGLLDYAAEKRALETGEAVSYDVELSLVEPGDPASPQKARTLKIRLDRWTDPKGQPCLIGSVEDLTELAETKLSLEVAERRSQLAFTFDSLTGLLNRSQIEPCIDECIEVSQRSGSSFAVLLISLNGLKAVNSGLGHQAGDHLLRTCAKRIRQIVRAQTAVARFGGDEYVVILSDTDPLRAGQIAEQIVEMVEIPIDLDRARREVTCSVGIAMYPRDGESSGELLSNADCAISEGRRRRQNGCVHYFEPSIGRDVERKLSLSRDLIRAVDHHQIEMYLQPIVRHNGGQERVIGYEALARWKRGADEWVSPEEFVPLLEESGLIIEAGEQMLKMACEFIAGRSADDVYVSVNVSGHQIVDDGFLGMVDRVIQAAQVPYQSLALEITETQAMNDFSTYAQLLDQLIERGVRLMIDDFGTGYSNLSRLRELPFSTLKIDRSLIQDVPSNRCDCAILRTVISMAKELELSVLVEGIEETTQRDYLIDLGVNTFQGYRFGKPKPYRS